MSKLLKNPGNIQVSLGQLLKPVSQSTKTFQFQLVTFDNIQSEIDDNISDSLVQSLLQQNKHFLCFHTIEGSSNPEFSNKISIYQYSVVRKFPSCKLSKDNTVFPQIIVNKRGDYINNCVNEDQTENSWGYKNVVWNTDSKKVYRDATVMDCSYVTIINTDVGCKLTANEISNKTSFAIMLNIQGSKQYKDSDVTQQYVTIDVNNNGDTIIKVSKSSQVSLVVNNGNQVSGSLVTSSLGYNTPHVKDNNKFNPTTIFCYPRFNSFIVTSNLTSSLIDQNEIVGRIAQKQSSNLLDHLSPTLQKYPSSYSAGDSSLNIKDSSKTSFKSTTSIGISWDKGLYGSFAYCPISFCPNCVFQYYFNGVKNDQYQNTSYYIIPIYTDNNGDYSLSNKKILCSKTESMSGYDIYKAKIEVKCDVEKNNIPFEICGFIKVLQKSGKMNTVNQDGQYTQSVNGHTLDMFKVAQYNDSLEKFITNISLNIGLDGITGSMSLDKYAMKKDLFQLPQQNLGAITLNIKNGPYGSQLFGNRIYGMTDGLLFKGYGLQTSNTVNESSATMNVNLVGVQRKLQDMKLVNCPFWDGDKLFSDSNNGILGYFKQWTGCDIQYESQFCESSLSSFRVPASFDYQSPAVNFTIGTSCLDALKRLAQMCGLIMIMQPNGKIYFYQLDDYGRAYHLVNSEVLKQFDQSQIISYDVQPFLDNKYNTFVTLALLKISSSNEVINDISNCIPGIQITNKKPQGSNFPWSRIIANSIPGFVTNEELKSIHRKNIKFGLADAYQGSITVPGTNQLVLYDKIKVSGVTFFIQGITQNIDLQNKTWTTSFSLARLEL